MGKPRKHKRKGPKSTRSGCLLCKPHKHQNHSGLTHKDQVAFDRFMEGIERYYNQ